MIEIGSSQFPAACGTSPFVSRAKLYRVVAKGEAIDVNEYMLRGKRLESRVVAAVESRLGCRFEATGEEQQSRHVEVDDLLLRSTPDGRLGTQTGLEVKVRQNLSPEPPAKSLPQICGQMLLWDFQSVIYAEYAETLRIWRVFRSSALERTVTQAVQTFADFVRREIEPPRWSSRANPRPAIRMPLYERLL